MKKDKSKYCIQFVGLKNQEYDFEFSDSTDFFNSFDQDIIKDGSFDAKVKLLKSDSMLKLKFDINSKVQLQCDKTLKDYEENLKIERDYLFKFGQENEQISDEVEIIKSDTSEIDLAQHIYEYILLSIPQKKIHPDHRNDDDNPWVYLDNENKSDKDNEVDPRWDALKSLPKK